MMAMTMLMMVSSTHQTNASDAQLGVVLCCVASVPHLSDVVVDLLLLLLVHQSRGSVHVVVRFGWLDACCVFVGEWCRVTRDYYFL